VRGADACLGPDGGGLRDDGSRGSPENLRKAGAGGGLAAPSSAASDRCTRREMSHSTSSVEDDDRCKVLDSSWSTALGDMPHW